MNHSFEISWVGLCRVFGVLTDVEYDQKLFNVLASLYSQCSREQKNKLQDLYPVLVKRLQEYMNKSDYFREQI